VGGRRLTDHVIVVHVETETRVCTEQLALQNNTISIISANTFHYR